ncbi:ANTAR domain-containing protein [Blastococcus sp. CT_GayMR19]|uniref:GAF and ANTAR domain-containing protein n=1 Tax=Blastococcus sp. CT_GayMR19 TaxID=2559608 RepID=UPI001074844A|nr:GAF and ANTAR domain-containing protein [Blastococcus sp. CT_GayMR19]TFV72955.1 ANTAR domain-containing protein [Blastococcus sp. CT_GayMR19]
MDGYERLGQVFVELADTLVDDFDPVDFLQTLTDRSVELLGADAAGLTLADQRGTLRLVASTMEEARELEVFELQVREGPCLDCFDTGRQVVNVELSEAYQRWPTFTPVAVAAGFLATHALPLRLRTQVVGAMNLFTAEPGRLDDEHIAIGQAMADVATIGLLHERNLREQTTLSVQLQAALHSRVLIEQAKGVLAARAGIGVAEAFVRMRSYARRSGLSLTAVAAAVVDGSMDDRTIAAP